MEILEETRLKIYSSSTNPIFFFFFPNSKRIFFSPFSEMFRSFHVFGISSFPFPNLHQELRERAIETFWKLQPGRSPAFLFLKRPAYISNPPASSIGDERRREFRFRRDLNFPHPVAILRARLFVFQLERGDLRVGGS